MSPSDPPSIITLRVKVPPGYVQTGPEEYSLGSLPTSSTIGDLRLHIQQNVPGNPIPERQRLLYGGRALVDNAQTLADALTTRRDPSQIEYVLHLLVRGEPGAGATVPTPTPTAPQPAQNGGLGQNPQLAFHQAVHQHQMQRAAAGMQGIGGLQPSQNTAHQAMGPQPTGPALNNPQNGGTSQQETNNTDGQAGAPQQPQGALPPQGGPPRPFSTGIHLQGMGPGGQHFQMHHRTVLLPGMPGMPGMPGAMPQGFPPGLFNQPPGIGMLRQQMPHPSPAPSGPSALDRARENVADMRRMIAELRANETTTEADRQRINEMEERCTRLSDYIDPFSVGTSRPGGQTSRPSVAPPPGFAHMMNGPFVQRPQPSTDPRQVTAYVLSSPQGPQALIYGPEFGKYHTSGYQLAGARPTLGFSPQSFIGGQFGQGTASGLPPLPGTDGTNAAGARAPPPNANGVVPGNQDAQAQAAQAQAQEQQGPFQPLVAHFWLLFRVLIFAYFLLGANMGWRRPAALLFIGLGFWLLRTGLFGEGGILRRWWDGVIDVRRPGDAAAAQGAGNQQQAINAAGDQAPQDAPRNANNANAFPTPEETARRLLAEHRANGRAGQLREWVRPAERAGALFVASLWPGVGEAHVRAREAEERRLAEEEIERRRLEEEAKKEAEEAEKKAQEGEGDDSGKGQGEEKNEESKDIPEAVVATGNDFATGSEAMGTTAAARRGSDTPANAAE